MQCHINPKSSADLELGVCKSLRVTNYHEMCDSTLHVKTSSQLQNSENPHTLSPKAPAKGKGTFNLSAEQ